MEFINGVIFLKEVIVISFLGSCLFGAMIIIAAAMMFGGVMLHINGTHEFSNGKRIFGAIICSAGLAFMVFISIFQRSNKFITVFDNWGLTDHTGKYEVAVTADVDMNEFQDCYEIIDFKNGVYTIKVKEN